MELCLTLKKQRDCVEEDYHRCNYQDSLNGEAAPIWPKCCGPLPIKFRLLLDNDIRSNQEPQHQDSLHCQLKRCIAGRLIVLNHE